MAPDIDRKKRPSYPWYPGDWKRDTAVQACPPLTRHIWREMLDIMHDGEPYGHLTAGGVAIDPAALAGMLAGVTLAQVRKALDELEARRVFSRTPGGVIFSRRMVKDEALRNVRAAGGKDSLDNPNVPRPKAEKDGDAPSLEDPAEDTQEDTSKDTSHPRARDRACRAANASTDLLSRFDRFWEAYPKKRARGAAEKAFKAIQVTEGLLDLMLQAIAAQQQTEDWRKDRGHWIPYPATWLRAKQWDDDVSPPAPVAIRTWKDDCQERHDGKCTSLQAHEQQDILDRRAARMAVMA